MAGKSMDERLESWLFNEDLSNSDPIIDELINLETERQARRIVLIPSESICNPGVRRVLDSSLSNLYCEGYPSNSTLGLDEDALGDLPFQVTHYRRYSDRRFYKGNDYTNVIEALCRRRAAEAFANDLVPADRIFANVQPLSGAPANLAALDAFMNPGDTLMGMDLMQGGHLSHGSPFHVTGRNYRIVSYGVDPKTEVFDYDQIMELAKQSRPKVIVAGFTSYPWAPDWKKFRAIANEVGAILMADIAHPVGLAIAGAYPSPVGYADVITFTTHKTLMGPRGAVVLTTSEDHFNRVNMAVFPGQQGGPHLNTIAGIAAALKIAKTDKFKKLMFNVVDNAAHMVKCLKEAGLGISYGGTDTHLIVADLKTLGKKNGEYLLGEPAARILELAGIVTNKNTIPGDTETPLCTGIRMGTPWISQRGITKEQIKELSGYIVKVLSSIEPFHYDGVVKMLPRGKIDMKTLEEVKAGVDALASSLDGEAAPQHSAWPHFSFLTPVETKPFEKVTKGETQAVLIPTRMLKITGPRVDANIQNQVTADVSKLADGESIRTLMLNPDGSVMDDVLLIRVGERNESRTTGFCIVPNPQNADMVTAWMRGNAEGYILFEPTDITAKVEGPVTVEDYGSSDFPTWKRRAIMHIIGKDARAKAEKLAKAVDESAMFIAPKGGDDAYVTIPFLKMKEAFDKLAGLGISPAGLDVDKEWRKAAGLPCYCNGPVMAKSLPEKWFDLYKPYFIGQLKVADGVAADAKPEWSWKEPEEVLKRTPLFEEHKKLGARIVPFAGHEMPVWYSTIEEEHTAVRKTAGLFDVSHMGVFEISGPNATDFLDLVSANYARWLADGEAHYSYLFNPDGQVIDDIYVYRYAWDRYYMVVNASNEAKDWDWLYRVNRGEVLIDRQVPQRHNLNPAVLRNLKDTANGGDRRIDIAFQGPKALEVLLKLCDRNDERFRLSYMKRNGCMMLSLCGFPVAISRTGYTGEEYGFEIFVHPDKAATVWKRILEVGKDSGVLPIGLGARDSLRIEAGLPLYGHELAGEHELWPHVAGFPGYVKFHKPFFIGKQAMLKIESKRSDILVRFTVTAKGVRAPRNGDPVVSTRGDVIGYVTSCAGSPSGDMFGLAVVKVKAAKPGPVSIFSIGGSQKVKPLTPAEWQAGDKTFVPTPADIISRFPAKPSAMKKLKIADIICNQKK